MLPIETSQQPIALKAHLLDIGSISVEITEASIKSVCYLELVLLDKFIQVHRQQLKRYTDVTSESERIEHPDNVSRALRVLLPKMFQYPYLFLRLAVEPFLVPYHLEGNAAAVPVVVDFHHLPKAALAEHPEHLVAVRHVVVWNMNI